MRWAICKGEHAGADVHADVALGRGGASGVNDTTWGFFELAEPELGLGLGAVASDDIGGGPVVAVGHQHPFAEDLFFEVGASRVVAGPAGVAPGQRGQFRGRLGQGLVEATGLGGVQGHRVGEHDAPGNAEDLAAAVERGQPGNPVGVHEMAVGGGSGQQARAASRWDRPDETQPNPPGAPGPPGPDRGLAGVQRRGDVGGRTEVPLRDHLGLPSTHATSRRYQYDIPLITFLYRLDTL